VTDLPVLAFPSRDAFRDWLDAEHARSPGLWLRIARKATGAPSVTYAEALDVALCYGWIDGQKAPGDQEGWWLQRFSPRRPRSRWSRINREKAEALIASGEMRPAGLAEVEQARADGRWDSAYAGSRTATVPDDLQAALDASPAAAEAFAGLNAANRYAILYRVQDAKRPATRAARIEKFVAMLERGETLH
jgi:uncharacterized protein YdeI (YjbR/CyaY-like superfamily)